MSAVAMDEEALVSALRAGDQDAFRELVAQHEQGLHRFARGYVSPEIAEEAVGETWASVVRSIDRFEGRSSLKTWLYRILLNKVRTLAGRESRTIPFAAMGHGMDEGGDVPPIAADRLNGGERGPGYFTATPDRWEDMPAEEVERAELLAMILAAVADLPPAQREVVQLRDLEGFSAAEASETLGITAVNQRVLLHRGRVALRNRLQEYLTHAR